MDTNEIYMEMAELWTEFSTEHSKTTKAAHGRARSAATKMKIGSVPLYLNSLTPCFSNSWNNAMFFYLMPKMGKNCNIKKRTEEFAFLFFYEEFATWNYLQ